MNPEISASEVSMSLSASKEQVNLGNGNEMHKHSPKYNLTEEERSMFCDEILSFCSEELRNDIINDTLDINKKYQDEPIAILQYLVIKYKENDNENSRMSPENSS